MIKALQAKKEHHYVWANYLRNWSDSKSVWFLSEKGKLVFDSTRMIAKERFFYKVQTLTSEHIEIIRRWSSLSPENLQKLHLSALDDVCQVQKREAFYIQSGAKIEEAEQLFEAFKCNYLEDIHTNHENGVKDILEHLVKQDLASLNDKALMTLCAFIGLQVTRTKSFKEKALIAMSHSTSEHQNKVYELLKDCWWFLSYIMGINIGFSLYSSRHDNTICLLVNNTSTSFITSDQPVVNVHQDIPTDMTPPEDHQADFYYPLSPSVSFMLNCSDRFKSGINEVDEDTVHELNIKIAKDANIHIFGKDEASLKPYAKYVGEKASNARAKIDADS